MKKSLFILSGIFICVFFSNGQGIKNLNPKKNNETTKTLDSINKPDYTHFVNPIIGTGGHGHTFPGATLPFGMVQLSPDTRIDGSWDGCSGYHYSDKVIYGFSHTHLSGTGCSDYGDIMLMPMMGEPNSNRKVYSSKFSHMNEKTSPGYYSVLLDDDNIQVELTATKRTGFHKYTFSKKGTASIILDHTHRDELIESTIKVITTKRVEGMRRSRAWARDQVVYYVIDFSQPVAKYVIKDMENKPEAMAGFSFKVNENKPLYVRVAISFTSIEGARKNMMEEMPDWDFEKVKKNAKEEWNNELGKIEVSNEDPAKSQTFYTALYHCMIHPSIASDVDGMYLGRDFKVHKAEGYDYYSVFSLWDTYRALHPLLTIIDKKRTLDFIKTFLAQYKEGGRLPVWELASNETDCMIGYHSVSVIADAYVKGIRDFDVPLALEAMQKSATWNHLGLPHYMKKGFIESGDEHESVSKTLEYAYDDWCIARLADLAGKQEIAAEYFKRSKAWMNLYDPVTGFIRPRTNGGWIASFDPYEVNNNYTEANGWQYNFYVPHDVNSMMVMMGRENFVNKLDELFSTSSVTTGREQADISGLIGQYAHGNEPSHHIAYLYAYAEQPWKTQEKVHQVKTEFYKNTPGGLIGNEDCGQMSAWYVLSALGFYPVCPGSDEYVVGTPSFEKAIIHLESDTTYEIHALNLSEENYYVNYVETYVLTHDEITKGGSISFTMGDKPQKKIEPVRYLTFPTSSMSQPRPYMTGYLRAPVITAATQTFKDSLLIEISERKDAKTYYYFDWWECTNDTCLGPKAYEYTKPFYISSPANIYARHISGNMASPVIQGYFHKLPNNWSVEVVSKYTNMYSAGGNGAIIDGLYGTENWRMGRWQGYQGKDMEVIVDLKDSMKITEAGASFLQDSRSWIIFPEKVEVYISADGNKFELAATIINEKDAKDEKVQTQKMAARIYSNTFSRYVKFKAYTIGQLPEWHIGAGGDAHVFVDEVWVK